MSPTTRYAIKVIMLSLIFLPFNIAALIVLQEEITWWKISFIASALAATDIILIAAAKQAEKISHAKYSSKSTHEPR